MSRRAYSPDEVSDLVWDNRPEGARGYFIDFKNQLGRMERQPPSGSWSLTPTDIPVGIPEGLLHVYYVDEQGGYMKPATPRQRVVIEYRYDPLGGGSTHGTAREEFSALADKLSQERAVATRAVDEDDEPEAAELAAMQGAQERQLHLLTMDSLQNFLRDTLSHFVRLQEAATKGAQAQIEATVTNMKLLTQQSTKLLETQLAAAQLTKERMEELQPATPAPSFDLAGVLGSVLPFVQSVWHGEPMRPEVGGTSLPPRLRPASRPSNRDIVELEPFAGRRGSSADRVDGRAQATVGVIREMLDPASLERLVTEPAALEQFLQRMRTAAAPASGTKPATDGAPPQPAETSLVPRTDAPLRRPETMDFSSRQAEDGPSLAELIAEITRTSRA